MRKSNLRIHATYLSPFPSRCRPIFHPPHTHWLSMPQKGVPDFRFGCQVWSLNGMSYAFFIRGIYAGTKRIAEFMKWSWTEIFYRFLIVYCFQRWGMVDFVVSIVYEWLVFSDWFVWCLMLLTDKMCWDKMLKVVLITSVVDWSIVQIGKSIKI